MAMDDWKDLKTMQFYIKKVGVDTRGISNNLNLQDVHKIQVNVLNIKS